jgi:hypothetical protein
MHRRLVTTSAIAVVLGATCLTGAGVGSSAAAARDARGIPAGLAAAIRDRFGPEAMRSAWAARAMEGPLLGVSVALSADGTTALVGAPNVGPLSKGFGVCCHWRDGAAFVFHVSSAGSWSSTDTPIATLRPDNHDGFGAGSEIALSADGTTASVGAPSDGGRGVVYVFHVSAEDAWASSATPTANLTAGNSIAEFDELAVSSDGTTLVANAPGADEYGGTAFVFHVSSEGAWATSSTPTATLTDEAGGDGVAISGDGMTVLLSDYANYSDGGGGAAVYHVSAEDAWADSSTPNAILSDASITGEYSGVGASLALSGDGTVALASTSAGTVDVFHVSGAADWVSTAAPTANLTNAGGSTDDYFGAGVAVSTDGTTALVTAPGLHAQRGGAYIFHVSGEGAWASSSAPTATLTDSGSKPHDALAVGALSADGATVLLGAPGFNWETGEAGVFHAADASSRVTTSTPAATLTDSALPKPICVVPRLVGKFLFQAEDKLRNDTDCLLGKVTKVHSKAKRGRILWQSPGPKKHRPPGTKVKVKVAR